MDRQHSNCPCCSSTDIGASLTDLGCHSGKVLVESLQVRRFHPQIGLRRHCVGELRDAVLEAQTPQGGPAVDT